MGGDHSLNFFVALFALLQGALFLRFGISASSRSHSTEVPPQSNRIARADDQRERISPLARYAASAAGFLVAIALLMHIITAPVGYSILCLALAARSAADQIVEEREPRRRAALIGRSRSLDPILLSWVVMSACSGFLLAPWFFDRSARTPAILVTLCLLTMAVVTWRVATAPPLLFGDDIEAEQIVDRETRINRTGNACVLSLATTTVFLGVMSSAAESLALLGLCAAVLGWKSLYARHVTRMPIAS